MRPTRQRSLLPAPAWHELRHWYRKHGRHGLPWRSNRTPWRTLLAETLLHRTRADFVAQVFPRLAEEFEGPAHVLDRPEHWRALVRSVGLLWRAEAFLACCAQLNQRFGGTVPPDQSKLEGLSGIGHYVAAAVRCFAYDIPAVLVDTNTVRLASRISGQPASPAEHRSTAVHKLVSRLGPDGRPPAPEENYALLDLAAAVCLPAKPKCGECPVAAWCRTAASLPAMVDVLAPPVRIAALTVIST